MIELQRVDCAVLLSGQALIDAAVLVSAGIRASYRDDGITAARRIQTLADVLTKVAREVVSEPGRADVRAEVDLSPSLADEITNTEAATMLGIGERQTRRIMPQLGARRTAAGWLITRGAVLAHTHERSNKS